MRAVMSLRHVATAALTCTLALGLIACSESEFGGSALTKGAKKKDKDKDKDKDGETEVDSNNGTDTDEKKNEEGDIDDDGDVKTKKGTVTIGDDGSTLVRFRGDETAIGKLSVVVAVDTSGSMGPSITRAMTQLKGLATEFLAQGEGSNLFLVAKDSPYASNPAHGTLLNAPADLLSNPRVAHFPEFVGSCNALEAVLKLLKAGEYGSQKIHLDGALHIIVVSDDDAGQGNCSESNSEDIRNDGVKHDAARFQQEFAGLTTVPKDNTFVHAFIRLPTSDMTVCGTGSGANVGDEYITLANATSPKGKVNDLCRVDADWTQSFGEIEDAARKSAKTSFTLPSTPDDPSALSVTVDGQVQDLTAYSYDPDANAIVFHPAPEREATIQVSYRAK